MVEWVVDMVELLLIQIETSNEKLETCTYGIGHYYGWL